VGGVKNDEKSLGASSKSNLTRQVEKISFRGIGFWHLVTVWGNVPWSPRQGHGQPWAASKNDKDARAKGPVVRLWGWHAVRVPGAQVGFAETAEVKTETVPTQVP